MKTKTKSLLLLSFFALLLFASCQDEVIEITDPTESDTLVAESELTSLMYSTSIMDGSADNIIDKASCTSVKLPITVQVNGLEVIIDSQEDFKVIEAIFKKFDDDDDELEIVFPITIILSDYQEIVIQNKDALEELIEDCREENREDEDIECVDFQYPISFSVYNTQFQDTDVITVENDKQLHRFIKRVKKSEVFASLNFPVTMVFADGETLEVNDNKTLAKTIREAKNACDEDDDNDYGDDDFTKKRLDEYLQICPWVVSAFKRNNQDNTEVYAEYALNFKEDGVVVMRARGGDVLTGSWSSRITDRGALLKMEFETLADFTLEWVVYDIEYGKIKLFEVGGNRIIMKKNCDVVIDHSKERIESYLQECLWRIERINVNGIDNEKDYIGTPLKFYEDNVVKLRVNGDLIQGTYEIGVRNIGFILKIDLEGRPNLKLEWLITFLEPGLIKLSNENNKMIMERHCPEGDDDLNEMDDILISSTWKVTLYKVDGVVDTAKFENWAFGFNENGKAFAEGDGRNVYGSWITYRKDGLYLGLKYDDIPLLNSINHRWKIVEITTDRIELNDLSSTGEVERILVFEKFL